MRKAILLVAIAMLGFPVLIQTALMETELSYKPRNARGIHSFGTYLGGTGQINLANGNLVYSYPIVSRSGRGGFGVDLSLNYNGKIWARNSGGMYVPERRSLVGLGWYLGFPKLIQGVSTYAIVFPDGSSHEIQQYTNGTWKSVDSTYILLDVPTKTATLKGGTKLVFGITSGSTSYLTQMKDTNGNKITAAYAGPGQLAFVQDTIGTVASFYYTTINNYQYLDYVETYGPVNTRIYFEYSEITSPMPSFSVPKTFSTSGERHLRSVRIAETPGPNSNAVGQEFSYGCVGEISAIDHFIQQYDHGWPPSYHRHYKRIAEFTFGMQSFADPTYTTVEERVITSKKEYTSSTESYITSLSYTFNGNGSNPIKTSATDVRGITDYSFNASTHPTRSWSDGLVSSVQRKNLGQTKVYQTEATDWEQDIPSVSYKVNPRPIRQTTTLDDDQKYKTELSYLTDGTGNVRQSTLYKFGNSQVLRSATTFYLYESNPAYAAKNMTGLPVSVSITDGNGMEVARTEYGFDEYPLSTYPAAIYNHDTAYDNQSITARGNPTSVKNKYIEQSRFLVTTTLYDTVGNAVSVTDPKNNPPTTQTYSSSSQYAYPQNTVNALNHVTQQTWSTHGFPTSILDANGAAVQYWYDTFGRLTQEITPVETTNYGYDDYDFVTTNVSSSGTRSRAATTRKRFRSMRQSAPGGPDVTVDAEYDNPWGQPISVSYPHRDGAASTSKTFTYDPLGRVLTEAIPGTGTIAYEYVGNAVTVTDASGKRKKYTYDELGNISRINEEDSSNNLTVITTYSYDALGKLTQIVQYGQGGLPNQTRSFAYDSLGRLTSETFPESGTNAYTYDDNGNVLTKTDARGVVITSTYDALNRRTATTFSDGTPSATYTYDQTTSSLIGLITNSKGRMTSAWTSDGIGYSWTYDIGGRATQQMASIDGVQYSLGFSYLEQGCGCAKSDLQQITYPDSYAINYSRDAIGRISSISDSTTTYATYSYGAANGAMSGITWRDNVLQSFQYDAIGRLSLLSTNQINGANVQTVDWNYSYNQNSQISQINEHVYRNYSVVTDQQAQFIYGYDHLGRLSSATHKIYNGVDYSEDQTNSFSYDQFGNMLTNNLTFPNAPQNNWYSNFNVSASNNRLVSYTNSEGTTATTYNAAGNMLTEGSRSYAYDGAGRMTSAGPGVGTYRYDALGRRIKKTYSYQGESGTISGSTISIYGPGGELLADYTNDTDNISRTAYILYGSQAIARRLIPQSGSATVKDLYRNHLNQVLDLSTYTFNTGRSTMYGIPYLSGGNDQFSGHKDDPESGLHYNLARSYNATIARWISPDSIVGNGYDPQSLNKYGYVRNDPINLVDPDGMWPDLVISIEVLAPRLSGFELYIAVHSNLIDDLLMVYRAMVASYMVAPEMPSSSGGSGGGGGGGGAMEPENIISAVTGRINKIRILLDGTEQKPCEKYLEALSNAVGIPFSSSSFAKSAAEKVIYDPSKTGKGTPNGYYNPATGYGYVYPPAFRAGRSGDYVSTIIHENFHVVSKLTDQNLMTYIGIAIGHPSLGSVGTVVGGPDPYFSRYCGPNPQQFP